MWCQTPTTIDLLVNNFQHERDTCAFEEDDITEVLLRDLSLNVPTILKTILEMLEFDRQAAALVAFNCFQAIDQFVPRM